MRNKYKVPTNIKKRNAWFNALSSQEKKIAIAKDAIQQIEIGKYKAKQSYGYFTLGEYMTQDNRYQISDLQCEIDKAETCSLCGMGAVFASRVRLGNDITNAKPDGDDIVNILEDVFEEEELRLIEAAFEGDGNENYFETYEEYDEDEDTYFTDYEPLNNAVAFHDNELGASEMLIKILNNVIENNGEFKP
jgi:hypothetical protein